MRQWRPPRPCGHGQGSPAVKCNGFFSMNGAKSPLQQSDLVANGSGGGAAPPAPPGRPAPSPFVNEFRPGFDSSFIHSFISNRPNEAACRYRSRILLARYASQYYIHSLSIYIHSHSAHPDATRDSATMQAQVSLALPLGSRSSRFHDQTSHVAAHFYSHSPAQLAQQLDAERSRIQQLQLLIDQEERKVCVQCAKAR